ncbi:MAG TPA: nitroreductase [Alphaproteobacteria bacterium]
MTVDEAITTRRSVRAFLPDPVPEATVRHILEVAARAPSGTNIQPWHVYVVAGEARERVCREVLAARERGEASWHYAYYPKTWREPYLARRRKVGWDLYGLLGIVKGDKEGMWRHFGRNFLFFDAPVGLFFTLDADMELGSWIDVGLFIQNVMIAARGQGLDTCPQAAWVEYHRAVHQAVGIPDTEKLVCGMALGYEDKSKPENKLVTEREPVDAFAKFLGF